MLQGMKLLFQTALLVLIYYTCSWLVSWLHLPIPPNVLGIVVLFTLLCMGIIKEEHIQEAAAFFLKHLVFFFVAVAVALINLGAIFSQYGVVLVVALLVSSALPLYVVGKMMQKFMKEKE